MKKIIGILLIISLLAVMLCSCGGEGKKSSGSPDKTVASSKSPAEEIADKVV